MRNEQEIKEMIKRIEGAINVDDPKEYDRVYDDKAFLFICDTLDTLNWVLEEISTEHFLSDAYMDLERLQKKAKGRKI